METITNYQIDQRITYKGLVHVIISIDNESQTLEVYNTYTGSVYDIKVTEL